MNEFQTPKQQGNLNQYEDIRRHIWRSLLSRHGQSQTPNREVCIIWNATKVLRPVASHRRQIIIGQLRKRELKRLEIPHKLATLSLRLTIVGEAVGDDETWEKNTAYIKWNVIFHSGANI